MSSYPITDQDSLYYLYLNSEWAGPYQVEQIRDFVKANQLSKDAYAYDASQQRHHTVEDLLAQKPSPVVLPSSPARSSSSSLALTVNEEDGDVVDIAPAQAPSTFSAVVPDLRAFYIAYIALTEHSASDPRLTAGNLRKAHQALIASFTAAVADSGALSRLVNDLDEVADYIANRQQIPQLWTMIGDLEKLDLAANGAEGVSIAKAVLAFLSARAELEEPASRSSNVLLDLDALADEDENDSVATRKILLSARHEVQSTKRDMDALHDAYTTLQDQHNQDLEKARKLLEKAEAARAEERHMARQTSAEVRNLAAEILRLASEPDVTGSDNAELIDQVAKLSEELRTADASTLTYLAEDVLVRLADHLRTLIAQPGSDASPLRAELERVRVQLAEARNQVAVLTVERDALKQQYEQQCVAAERASERAKEREQRLRSTVTALEVTKELHQEVMTDLQGQLNDAQTRVEAMERDLTEVRGELKSNTGSIEARGKELQDEMARNVEMKAMLEVRSTELSASLHSAEAELEKARSGDDDATLIEALAAKANHLRLTFETTCRRLQEQQEAAARLTTELEASRQEARELRGRSDELNTELIEARSSLTGARKRVEELNDAYRRLESERESLQSELESRKSTDTIHRQVGEAGSDTASIERRLAETTRQSDSLSLQLSSERRKVLALADAQVQAQARVEELTAEREELRHKLEALQGEHTTHHARHTAAIAASTQAAIESEKRLKVAQRQLAELEDRLQATGAIPREALEPSTVRNERGGALESDEVETLRAELVEARERLLRAERDLARARDDEETRTPKSGNVELTKRLSLVEEELTRSLQLREDLSTKLTNATAERERMRREIERAKSELESAAVEHRTALKSARDKLTEAQERSAALEAQLASSGGDSAMQNRLAAAVTEQERLAAEVRRLSSDLERQSTGAGARRDEQLIELTKATQQLAGEQQRVQVLTRSLVEAMQATDTARSRGLDLQGQLDQALAERDRLKLDSERLRGDVALMQAGDAPTQSLRDALAERDRALGELEKVSRELAELRAILTSGEQRIINEEKLNGGASQIRLLESRLAEMSGQRDQTQQMFNEARARLVQVSSERDRLSAELAELRTRPNYDHELKRLRKRLVRAKARIRELREERDRALADRERSASNVQELTTHIERLRGAQRAAAEALGLPMPPEVGAAGVEAPGYGSAVASGFGSGGFSTRHLGKALRPLADTPTSQNAPKALTKRIMGNAPRPPGFGFTSAFGRPQIPGLSNIDSPEVMPAQTRMTVALENRPRQTARAWLTVPRPGWKLVSGMAAAAGTLGILLMPPLLPYSVQGVVNAEVVWLTAPIDGQVSSASTLPGAKVRRDAPLVTLRNEHVDTSVLDGLRLKREQSGIKRAQLGKDIVEQEHVRGELKTQLADYRQNLTAELEKRLTLESRMLAMRQEAAAKPGADPQAAQAVTVQLALVDQLSRQLSSVRAGLFLTEDAPLASRKLDEQAERIAELVTQQRALDDAAPGIDRDVAAEEKRLARLREATVLSPHDGVLLKQAGDQRWVKTGEQLVAVANGTTVQVEALVDRRYLHDIGLGDTVAIHLVGERRVIRGTVREPLKLGTDTLPSRARVLTSAIPTLMKLVVDLDPADAQQVSIGQDAKLIVLGNDPGLVRRALAWFYERTRL